jgi:hypothetical protein
MAETDLKEEMFELANHSSVLGYRVQLKDKLGFDCFLHKPSHSGNKFILYDETSGEELGYVNEDLNVSIEKVKNFVRKKVEMNMIVSLHNDSVSIGNILARFAKGLKIQLTFNNKKNIIFKNKEYLDDFVKEFNLSKHFHNICNHSVDNGYAQNDTCYIYCGGLIVPVGIKKEERKVEVNLETLPFMDVLDYIEPKAKGMVSRTITFYTQCADRRYTLAHYIYDMNTLLLSDISHSNDYVWVSAMMSYLKTNVFIKSDIQINNKVVLTIGSDPEFEVHHNGKNICGPELQTGNRLRAKIGCDGSGRQMEFRPDPKRSHEEATKEIQDILDSISYHNIRCDGDQEPLGGHLHFGVNKNGITGKLIPSEDMIKALDMFIGKHLQKFSGKARREYGKLHDYRDQPWGFEYRTLPSAFFFTKEMTAIVYKIAYNVVKYFIDNGNMELSVGCDKEDYIKYAKLTESEYDYFVHFDKVYTTESRKQSITKNWVSPKEHPLKIIFYDMWEEEIKREYIEVLMQSIVTKPITLCMYGINETRGENTLAGLNNLRQYLNSSIFIPHPKDSHITDGIAIGFGKKYRTNSSSTNVMTYICNEIKNKIGIANETNGPITTMDLFPDEILNRSTKPNNTNEVQERI